MARVLWKISNLIFKLIIPYSCVFKNQEDCHFLWKNKFRVRIPKTLKFHEIWEVTQSDQILTKVPNAINNNRCRFYKNDIHIKSSYYILQKERVFHDSVILRKQKLVIPHCLRRFILRLAHERHISIVKCKARLWSKFWWLHIDSEVSPLILEFQSCQTTLDHHQPASMMPIPTPESPWLSVAVDFMWSISNWRNFTDSSGLLFSISIRWDFKKYDFCNHYF